jgi:hypothetical protein
MGESPEETAFTAPTGPYGDQCEYERAFLDAIGIGIVRACAIVSLG